MIQYDYDDLKVLKKKYKDVVDLQIKEINNKRFMRLSFLIIILLIILMFFMYIPDLKKNGEIGIASYSYLRLSLVTLFISSMVFYLTLGFKTNKEKFIYNFLYPAEAFIYLVELSFFGVLDSMYEGSIGVYLAALTACSSIVLLEKKTSLIVYVFAEIFFVFMILTLDGNNIYIKHSMVSSFIFMTAAFIISCLHYENQVEFILKTLALHELNKKTEKLSNYDGLTDLRNRRSFEGLLRSNFYRHKKGTVALIDIDFFKRINDEYGHHTGDRVLINVSDTLRTSIKNDGIVSRWGGEEFAIFFINDNLDEVEKKLNKIRENIEMAPIIDMKREINVTVSIGFAKLYGGTNETVEFSFKKADEALYKAKNNGRNQVVKELE